MLRDANQNSDVNNIDFGFTSIATAAGTTTLTVASPYYIYFTGATTQTVVMPVTNTLALGWSYHIANNSTGNITVNSSGANLIGTILPGTTFHITCIDTAVTTAAGWDFGFTDFGTATGTGSVVLSASPTFTGTVGSGNITSSGGLATSSTATISFIGTGTIAIGATTGTAAITVGQSTGAQTLNLATGATLTATTKTVNIGTTGVSGSTTAISIGSAVSGATTTLTLSGTVTSSSLADAVGYKGLPPSAQTQGSAITLALTDMGKIVPNTLGGWVIPANGSVPFPVGSTVIVYNDSAANQTISITTDTMYLAGTATTGSRTLAQRGLATLVKVASTTWVASGAGVT
jgi:hypothetical protein